MDDRSLSLMNVWAALDAGMITLEEAIKLIKQIMEE